MPADTAEQAALDPRATADAEHHDVHRGLPDQLGQDLRRVSPAKGKHRVGIARLRREALQFLLCFLGRGAAVALAQRIRHAGVGKRAVELRLMSVRQDRRAAGSSSRTERAAWALVSEKSVAMANRR